VFVLSWTLIYKQENDDLALAAELDRDDLTTLWSKLVKVVQKWLQDKVAVTCGLKLVLLLIDVRQEGTLPDKGTFSLVRELCFAFPSVRLLL